MKNLFFMLFVIFTTTVSAQFEEFVCATDDGDIPNLENVYTYSSDANFLASMDPVILNVYYWRVDAPNSVHPNALTEQRALESIAYLNKNFNSIGVFFKYRGMGNFNSPTDVVHKIWDFELGQCVTIPGDDPDGFETLSRCQRGALISYANNQGYVKNDAINFYVPRGLTDFGGSSQGPLKSITHPNGLINNTIIHELGHNFSLPHSWSGWYQPNNPNNCEHVTRIESDPNFNALNKGDRFVGTDAMPDFLREYCTLNGLPNSDCIGNSAPHGYEYYDIENCVYKGTDYPNNRTDCEGTPYQISPEDGRNTMAYAPSTCRDNFSIDQGIKMREHIINSSSLQNATNFDASSLYEPYKGEYYAAGPFDPVLHKPLLQPGFSYRFVECSGPYTQPANYEDTFSYNAGNVLLSFDIDEVNFNAITHPNHSAILIGELAPFTTDANGLNKPRKCYNNFNKAPSGGSITKFNDGVLNTNVTITAQDSTAINNQNLINDLPNGLYKVEKIYDDGAVQETIILKGNN